MRRDCTKVLRGDHLAFAVWPYSVPYGLSFGEVVCALRTVYGLGHRVGYHFVSAVDGRTIPMQLGGVGFQPPSPGLGGFLESFLAWLWQ